jgi:hypothetical protein
MLIFYLQEDVGLAARSSKSLPVIIYSLLQDKTPGTPSSTHVLIPSLKINKTQRCFLKFCWCFVLHFSYTVHCLFLHLFLRSNSRHTHTWRQSRRALRCLTDGSRGGRLGRLSVVLHVLPYQVIGRQGSHQTQLTRQHRAAHDLCKLP